MTCDSVYGADWLHRYIHSLDLLTLTHDSEVCRSHFIDHFSSGDINTGLASIVATIYCPEGREAELYTVAI